MEGVVELAEEIFHMPVSLGYPRHVTGLKEIVRNPIYSTGVGLLMYGKQREEEAWARGRNRSSGMLGRLKHWVAENL